MLVWAARQCSALKCEWVKEVALAGAMQGTAYWTHGYGSCGGGLRVEEEGGQPIA